MTDASSKDVGAGGGGSLGSLNITASCEQRLQSTYARLNIPKLPPVSAEPHKVLASVKIKLVARMGGFVHRHIFDLCLFDVSVVGVDLRQLLLSHVYTEERKSASSWAVWKEQEAGVPEELEEERTRGWGWSMAALLLFGSQYMRR